MYGSTIRSSISNFYPLPHEDEIVRNPTKLHYPQEQTHSSSNFYSSESQNYQYGANDFGYNPAYLNQSYYPQLQQNYFQYHSQYPNNLKYNIEYPQEISFYERFFHIQSHIIHYSQEDPIVHNLYQYILAFHSNVVEKIAEQLFGYPIDTNYTQWDENYRELLFHNVCIQYKTILTHWYNSNESPASYWVMKSLFDRYFSPEEIFNSHEQKASHLQSNLRVSNSESLFSDNWSREVSFKSQSRNSDITTNNNYNTNSSLFKESYSLFSNQKDILPQIQKSSHSQISITNRLNNQFFIPSEPIVDEGNKFQTLTTLFQEAPNSRVHNQNSLQHPKALDVSIETFHEPPSCAPMIDTNSYYITIPTNPQLSTSSVAQNTTQKLNDCEPQIVQSQSSNDIAAEIIANKQDIQHPTFWKYNIGNTEFFITSNYKAKEILGGGTYGVVVSAFDIRNNMDVAIKKQNLNKFGWNKDYYKRLLREIRILQHVDHPNLMSLLDLIPPIDYSHFDAVYIVTQKMDHSLHDIIHGDYELKSEHIGYIMFQMTSALRYLHGCSLIHRDLKPENILIDENCEIRIIDFGLSKSLPLFGSAKNSTSVVSLFYRAPELLLGVNEFSEAIDIWSLGAIFAELFYPGKESLFQSNSCQEALKAIFSLIGSPTASDLLAIKDQINKLGYEMLNSLGTFTKKNLREIIPLANDDAIDLIEKMLVFNPKNRISAKEALNHPYFLNQGYNPDPSDYDDIRMDITWEKDFDIIQDAKRILFDYICKYNFHQNNLIVGEGKYTILGEKHSSEDDSFNKFT